jgi:hypothetical protein
MATLCRPPEFVQLVLGEAETLLADVANYTVVMDLIEDLQTSCPTAGTTGRRLVTFAHSSART